MKGLGNVREPFFFTLRTQSNGLSTGLRVTGTDLPKILTTNGGALILVRRKMEDPEAVFQMFIRREAGTSTTGFTRVVELLPTIRPTQGLEVTQARTMGTVVSQAGAEVAVIAAMIRTTGVSWAIDTTPAITKVIEEITKMQITILATRFRMGAGQAARATTLPVGT